MNVVNSGCGDPTKKEIENLTRCANMLAEHVYGKKIIYLAAYRAGLLCICKLSFSSPYLIYMPVSLSQ